MTKLFDGKYMATFEVIDLATGKSCEEEYYRFADVGDDVCPRIDMEDGQYYYIVDDVRVFTDNALLDSQCKDEDLEYEKDENGNPIPTNKLTYCKIEELTTVEEKYYK